MTIGDGPSMFLYPSATQLDSAIMAWMACPSRRACALRCRIPQRAQCYFGYHSPSLHKRASQRCFYVWASSNINAHGDGDHLLAGRVSIQVSQSLRFAYSRPTAVASTFSATSTICGGLAHCLCLRPLPSCRAVGCCPTGAMARAW